MDFVTENIVKTPVGTGYKCSCGETKEKNLFVSEDNIDLWGDYVDNILYWIAYYWIEETVVPESTDKACLNAIQEYIEQQRK